ncbi:hypothetical protein AN958_07096, partial [Leucoagaricus sp. SymC.cos]
QGVHIDVLKPGDGKTFPKRGDRVVITYIGRDDRGRQFDSTDDHGCPFETEIGTGKVIKGWDQGIMRLSKGQKAVLTISSDLAYGSEGYPPVIYPNATLIFEIELLDVIPKRC